MFPGLIMHRYRRLALYMVVLLVLTTLFGRGGVAEGLGDDERGRETTANDSLDTKSESSPNEEKKDEEAAASKVETEKDAGTEMQKEGEEGGSLLKRMYYFNMDDSHDRRRHMEKMLGKQGIPYERIVPFPMNETKKLINDFQTRNERTKEENKERGMRKFCEYEHFNKMVSFSSKPGGSSLYLTWEGMVDKVLSGDVPGAKEGDLVFVFEDDAVLEDNWRETFEEAIPQLQKDAPDWAVARIGWWGHQREKDAINKYWKKVSYPLFIPGWPPTFFYHGTTALMLKVGNGSQPLSRLFHKQPLCWCESVIAHEELASYVIDHHHMLAKHGEFETTLHKEDSDRRRRRHRKRT